MTERPTALTLRLQASPTYIVGQPMFVEVTLANETESAEYYALIPCDPWSPPFPVEFTFSAAGQDIRLPARSVVRPGAKPRGFDLVPAEARTSVLDLSELETPVPSGTWQLAARWVMRNEQPRSPPVTVTLASVDPADAPLLQRLRRVGGRRNTSWANLVKEPGAFDEAALHELSQASRRALLPYLIMHQAVHGPEPLSRFPVEFLSEQRQGPWGAEAAVLEYELAWARQAVDLAAQRAAVLARWPGLAFRLDQIQGGMGLLTTLREACRQGGAP